MASPDHVIINHRFITAQSPPATRPMAGERMMVGIDAAQILCHLAPRALAPLGAFINFASQDPDGGVGAIPRHQIAPVPLDAGDSGHLHAVTVASPPTADDRRDDPGINQMLEAPVGVVEIGGVNPAKIPAL